MTRILTVTRNDLDQFEIRDGNGKSVEGPFETNAAAWKALDRLDQENVGLPKPRSTKPVLWGKPEKGKSKKKLKREQKISARQEKQMKRDAAHKANGWVRNIASAKFDPQEARKFKDYKLGTFGPASAVKRIDPAEYLAEKAARGER